jgi:hypothetical protein
MRKSTALRVLHLFSLLPSTLAQVICYDIASPMHPEILTPVNCWQDFSMSQKSTNGGGDGDGDGDGGWGYSPPPPPGKGGNRNNKDGSSKGSSNGYDTDYDSDSDNSDLPFFSSAPYSPLSEMLQQPALPPPSWESPTTITFNIDCSVSGEICYAFSSTLELAAWYVSQVPTVLSPW